MAPHKTTTKTPAKKVSKLTMRAIKAPKPEEVEIVKAAPVQPRRSSSLGLRQGVVDISAKAAELRDKHVRQSVDGNGKPVPKVISEYLIKFEDGTVLHAEGRHADVIAHFIDECQAICLGAGMAAYNGPPMTKYSANEWAARIPTSV